MKIYIEKLRWDPVNAKINFPFRSEKCQEIWSAAAEHEKAEPTENSRNVYEFFSFSCSLTQFIGTMLDPIQVNFWQKCAAGRNKRYDKLLWISESIQPQRFAIDIFGCRRNKQKKASNVSSNSVKFPNPNETATESQGKEKVCRTLKTWKIPFSICILLSARNDKPFHHKFSHYFRAHSNCWN